MPFFKTDKETHAFAVAGKAVKCGHCGGEQFVKSQAQLHSAGLTFMQLEWLGKSVHVLACGKCSHIEWFGSEPEQR